ncbi:MAG: hypothetical protein A4E55_01048 [Pelotomaculum sp. PtaU1.Bin035]|nr:MAG: hypothetical protein A4E55_01048 [Pelotomaculum sp. PtaU1.Bin035]
MKSTKGKKEEPILAPGSKGILEKSASKEEIQKGNSTRVTTLLFDEVDPSLRNSKK